MGASPVSVVSQSSTEILFARESHETIGAREDASSSETSIMTAKSTAKVLGFSSGFCKLIPIWPIGQSDRNNVARGPISAVLLNVGTALYLRPAAARTKPRGIQPSDMTPGTGRHMAKGGWGTELACRSLVGRRDVTST